MYCSCLIISCRAKYSISIIFYESNSAISIDVLCKLRLMVVREATSDIISLLSRLQSIGGGVSRLMRRLTTSRLITCFRAGSLVELMGCVMQGAAATAKWGSRGLADLWRTPQNTHTREKRDKERRNPPTNYARGGSFEQGNKQQLSQ